MLNFKLNKKIIAVKTSHLKIQIYLILQYLKIFSQKILKTDEINIE